MWALSFTDHSQPSWLHCPAPLGQDRVSGPMPFSWSHQPKLIRTTGFKQHLQGQLGIHQKEPRDIKLGLNECAQPIHVCDVICCRVWLCPNLRKEESMLEWCHCGRSSVSFLPLVSVSFSDSSYISSPFPCLHNTECIRCSLVESLLLHLLLSWM